MTHCAILSMVQLFVVSLSSSTNYAACKKAPPYYTPCEDAQNLASRCFLLGPLKVGAHWMCCISRGQWYIKYLGMNEVDVNELLLSELIEYRICWYECSAMTNVIRQLCVDDSSSVHNSQRNQALAIRKPTADISPLQKSPEALTQDRRIQRLERAMQLVETSNCLVCFCGTVEYRGINSKREIFGVDDGFLFVWLCGRLC